jgi:hypothetical protein
VRFVVRPYRLYEGLLPPDTPVCYRGERAAHIYEQITSRPHLDVLGNAQASADPRYIWSIHAQSATTGELHALGRP